MRGTGAGRLGIEQTQPGIKEALEQLVDPATPGDPTSPLCWTFKSRARLAVALSKSGWVVSSTTARRLLHELGYSLQLLRKKAQMSALALTADDFRGEWNSELQPRPMTKLAR